MAGELAGGAGRLIVVVAALTARPDRLAEVEAIVLGHVRRARGEPGCIAYDLARDLTNDCRFLFAERWTDLAAFASHSISDITRATVESLGALIVGETAFEVYDATPVTLP